MLYYLMFAIFTGFMVLGAQFVYAKSRIVLDNSLEPYQALSESIQRLRNEIKDEEFTQQILQKKIDRITEVNDCKDSDIECKQAEEREIELTESVRKLDSEILKIHPKYSQKLYPKNF